MIKKPEKIEVDDVDIWIRQHNVCPNGVIGVDWNANIGFGRWEMIMDENGIPHIHSEGLDSKTSKDFSKLILQAILDKAIVDY